MGGIFSKPKKPKMDADQKALINQQKEKLKDQESEIARRKGAKRNRSLGKSSLITGSATGIPSYSGTSTPTRTTTG